MRHDIKYDDAQVRKIARQLLQNMYCLGRNNAAKFWNFYVENGRKWQVGRALVTMRDVAKNPEKYFSRENTQAAWDKRANDFIQKNGRVYGSGHAFVASPVAVIHDKTGILFINDYSIRREYMRLCNAILSYEYSMTSDSVYDKYCVSEMHANSIIALQDVIKDLMIRCGVYTR